MIKFTPQLNRIGWDKVVDIGPGRQVFWDDHLIDDEHTDAVLRINRPVKLEPPFEFDAEWEGNWLSYANISYFDGVYRMYYITGSAIGVSDMETDTGRSLVCMIESRDGIEWYRPVLNITEWKGSKENNIVLQSEENLIDNFFVFVDENPNCPANEKVKATSMIERKEKSLSEGRRELWCYTSPDGLHFKKAFKMTDSSVPNGGIFDSLNVAFYDKIKGKYLAYVRGLHDGPGRGTAGGLRDIRYMESDDLRVWSDPVNLCFGDSDDVELYTNNVSRYYRAPHVFVGFPTRYTERHWLVKNFDHLGGQKNAADRRAAASMFGEREGYVITDGLFMCSHDGVNFHKFDEALFTPGPEHDYNWVYGDCYPAYGMIETKRPYPYDTTELSMYLFEGHLRVKPQRLYRYVIRLDGFASYHADYKKKTVTTKPLMFEGDTLTLNFSTSGAGYIYVRVLDFYGKPIDGYTSHEIFGDAYDRPVVFPGGFELSRIQGMPVRLEFTMSDADIYSMDFTSKTEGRGST
ncbi:MAG: hypothetical protein J5879_08490 [Clostridia bacterium]|nr:hypothetical protein [Clostridia bacterium]